MEKYFKLIGKISNKYTKNNEDKEDLHQTLMIKLCKLENHTLFNNYGFINNSLYNEAKNFLASNSKIKLSVKERKEFKKLSSKPHLTADEKEKLQYMYDNKYYKEVGFENDDEQNLYLNSTPSYDDKIILLDIIKTFNDTDKQIMFEFYFNNNTDQYISELINKTKNYVKCRRRDLLNKLKQELNKIGYIR